MKDFGIDYTTSKPKKTYIPPMNRPQRRQHFGKFVKQQKHHCNDSNTDTARGAEALAKEEANSFCTVPSQRGTSMGKAHKVKAALA